MDFKQIVAVKGLYVPKKKGEAYGADVLVQRGVFTLLVRYQYNLKTDAGRAVAALEARDVNAMPKTNLPEMVYMLGVLKVR